VCSLISLILLAHKTTLHIGPDIFLQVTPIIKIAHIGKCVVYARIARPLVIMTFLHNFLPKIVIRRNTNAVALSKDPTIFFSKAPRLALLDKLDDGLGKIVMLEPFFGAVYEVALSSPNIGKFTLATQTIGHQVGTPRLIFHDIVEFD